MDKRQAILATSEQIEEWGDDNGIVTSPVEQFELAERIYYLLPRLCTLARFSDEQIHNEASRRRHEFETEAAGFAANQRDMDEINYRLAAEEDVAAEKE